VGGTIASFALSAQALEANAELLFEEGDRFSVAIERRVVDWRQRARLGFARKTKSRIVTIARWTDVRRPDRNRRSRPSFVHLRRRPPGRTDNFPHPFRRRAEMGREAVGAFFAGVGSCSMPLPPGPPTFSSFFFDRFTRRLAGPS